MSFLIKIILSQLSHRKWGRAEGRQTLLTVPAIQPETGRNGVDVGKQWEMKLEEMSLVSWDSSSDGGSGRILLSEMRSCWRLLVGGTVLFEVCRRLGQEPEATSVFTKVELRWWLRCGNVESVGEGNHAVYGCCEDTPTILMYWWWQEHTVRLRCYYNLWPRTRKINENVIVLANFWGRNRHLFSSGELRVAVCSSRVEKSSGQSNMWA